MDTWYSLKKCIESVHLGNRLDSISIIIFTDKVEEYAKRIMFSYGPFIMRHNRPQIGYIEFETARRRFTITNTASESYRFRREDLIIIEKDLNSLYIGLVLEPMLKPWGTMARLYEVRNKGQINY